MRKTASWHHYDMAWQVVQTEGGPVHELMESKQPFFTATRRKTYFSQPEKEAAPAPKRR